LGGCSNSSLESDEELEELVSSLSTSCRYWGSGVGGFDSCSGSEVLGLSVLLPLEDFGKLTGNSVSVLSVTSRWASSHTWALTASLLSNSETISCCTSFANAWSSGSSSAVSCYSICSSCSCLIFLCSAIRWRNSLVSFSEGVSLAEECSDTLLFEHFLEKPYFSGSLICLPEHFCDLLLG
jgi:hypothetical protein